MKGRSQLALTELTLDKIVQYWEEACDLMADLSEDRRFSTAELLDYVNQHLPSDCEKSITETKVHYLRRMGILGSEVLRPDKRRTIWRYTPDDARRVLIAELLQARESISVSEILDLFTLLWTEVVATSPSSDDESRSQA